MPRIGDLIEERVGLIDEQRTVLDAVDQESRDLTAEERQEYDRRDARVDELTEEIRRHEQHQRHAELDIRAISPDEPDEPEGREIDRSSDEYRSALEAYCRRADLSVEQRSDLNVGTDGEGGFAVPEAWTGLYESLRETGILRDLAEVITTENGGLLHAPFVSADATEPGIVKEKELTPDDAEAFEEKKIAAYKYARMTKASEEMVQDALFDVEGFVGRRLGFDLGLAVNSHYVNGTGSEQPEGLFAKATVGKELATQEAIASDEIIDLLYSVTRPYRANGVWIAADSTVASIRKLKDENGQYLWQPSMQAGEPDLLLGKPLHTDPDVEPLTAKEKAAIGFGDVRRAYLIRDVLGVSIRILTERYAELGQVAWRGVLRTGGAIVDANAFKVAETPTWE